MSLDENITVVRRIEPSKIITPKPGPIAPVFTTGDIFAYAVSMTEGGIAWAFYKVLYVDSLPPTDEVIFDFGAINAGGIKDIKLSEYINVDENRIAQIRFRVLDDGIRIYHSNPNPRFRLKAGVTVGVTRLTHEEDSCDHQTEFWFRKDDVGVFRIENFTSSKVYRSRVLFYGFMYVVQPIKVPPEEMKKVAGWIVGKTSLM